MDKSTFSMDWYYPVLGCRAWTCGSRHAHEAMGRLRHSWLRRSCVSDQPWMTGAETAELAMALISNGQDETARGLLADIQCLRRDDGSYWTGIVVDSMKFFPYEASTWTAAAVVLACDALAGGTTLDLFTGRDLPVGLPFDDEACQRRRPSCIGGGCCCGGSTHVRLTLRPSSIPPSV